MQKSCCAIILRIIRYNDKTDIIDTYTNVGRLSFAINRPGKKNRSLSVKQQCHPLAILNIEADIKPKGNIHKIIEAHPAFMQKSIPFNPTKQPVAFFLAEFLSLILQEDKEDEETFNYIRNSIEWFDNSTKGFANFHLVFMIKIAHMLGLRPDISQFSKGCIFDIRNAVFYQTIPDHNNYLSPEDTLSLYQMMRLKYETMHLFKMNRIERNRCLDTILKYYSFHITSLENMKTTEVLKELFT